MKILKCAIVVALAGSAVLLGTGRTAHAQPLGIQDRADSASLMILLGVSQGIQSLPPTSGQSIVYEYDSALDTYVPSGRLGPAVFRSPRTIGEGRVSLRFAGSYFELYDDLGTIPYVIRPLQPSNLPPQLFTRLGTKVDAKVGLFTVSAGYGITEHLEVNLNVPMTIVDAQASNVAAVAADDPDAFVAAPTLQQLDAAIASGVAVLGTRSFRQAGANFNEGTSVGLGQISASAKYELVVVDDFRATPAVEIFFPSPNEKEFAGPNSFGFVPRLLTSYTPMQELGAYVDVGYNYVVDFQELTSFVWNAGLSGAPTDWLTLDTGVGGAVFKKGIVWTPDDFVQPPGQAVPVPLLLEADGDNTLGTNYVDFLFGVKVQVTKTSVLSGSVRVPVNDEGFRPYAAGTVGYEMYF